MSNLTVLKRALVFLVAFTAGYAAIRFVREEVWRWDHLAEIYAGMLVGLLLVWAFSNNKQTTG